MSFSIALEILRDGVAFKNECRKNSYIDGNIEYGKISQIPALLANQTEMIINLPLKYYNLNIVGLETIAILLDEFSNTRYVSALSGNIEIVSQTPFFQSYNYRFNLYDKATGISFKI